MTDETLDIDLHAWDRSLSTLGRQALPKAAAGTLTDLAFRAQSEAKAEMGHDFDRPTSFTMRAFRVDKAKPGDLGTISSRLYASPIQSRYLAFTVFGGERRAGDPGAGKYDVPVPGPDGKVSAAGGVPRGYAKRLAQDPNVFFGRLLGLRGYWKRPKRKGRASRGAPQLLLQFKDQTRQPVSFRLSLAIQRATIGATKNFANRLATEIRKLRG